jgi:hypothetical protein
MIGYLWIIIYEVSVDGFFLWLVLIESMLGLYYYAQLCINLRNVFLLMDSDLCRRWSLLFFAQCLSDGTTCGF